MLAAAAAQLDGGESVSGDALEALLKAFEVGEIPTPQP